MRNLYLFRNYGKDALLLSVQAYNDGGGAEHTQLTG